ncbi:fibrous sheath CABYR-binding protein isoform X2 [Diachasma alloeum]|uniref:fibrous sheath CABYR-binding protein isoform X2 n=1 Tax=Diachasma alloeum TaxID=454923 RepID=UPI000738439B|nr:fibrous sheath CABYR-binding protein isoform X2 [Diachasma alloeum]
METVVKVSRTVTGGVYRIFMKGARRVLAAIPLLGFYADEVDDTTDKSVTGGEEAETSPAEEKSTPASPTEAVPPADPVEPATPAVATTNDKNEASSTPAPTPVPLEAPKDDEKADKKPEVSQVQAAIVEPMVEVTSKSQPIVTASIIERKTSEDFPSHLPSSPPPTPIDPSPLQQAQQSAAHANQLAEALKLPAVSIVQTQCDNDSNKDVDDVIVKTDIKHSETNESSTEDDKELVVMSEEGPVPVTPVDEVSSVPEVAGGPKEILPEPEPEVIEEIVIEEVNQVEENIPVEEVEVEVIEEPDVLVSPPPPPPPTDEIEIVEEIETKEEVPPPLPESPIPVPKASSELLNFMSSQISDTPPLSSIIDCAAVPQETDSPQDKLEKTDETEVIETNEITNETDKPQAIDSQDVDDLPPPVDDYSESKHDDSLLTPPRSPSPSSLPSPSDESSNVNDNNSINNDRTETINNINCHNNVIDKEDRLADNNVDKMQFPLNYADIVKKDQSIAEPEAPVEKVSEVTTEKIEEAPKSPPPSVPTEVSAPAPPVITEDVASVIKAIEEIDINEKAVAAAVNENIESVNTNEIIADMNHQNTLKE